METACTVAQPVADTLGDRNAHLDELGRQKKRLGGVAGSLHFSLFLEGARNLQSQDADATPASAQQSAKTVLSCPPHLRVGGGQSGERVRRDAASLPERRARCATTRLLTPVQLAPGVASSAAPSRSPPVALQRLLHPTAPGPQPKTCILLL